MLHISVYFTQFTLVVFSVSLFVVVLMLLHEQIGAARSLAERRKIPDVAFSNFLFAIIGLGATCNRLARLQCRLAAQSATLSL